MNDRATTLGVFKAYVVFFVYKIITIAHFSVLDSPRLGSPQETYAQVVIAANDNPNGVLELSSAEVFVEENHSGTLISVVRSAGDFGQVYSTFIFGQYPTLTPKRNWF